MLDVFSARARMQRWHSHHQSWCWRDWQIEDDFLWGHEKSLKSCRLCPYHEDPNLSISLDGCFSKSLIWWCFLIANYLSYFKYFILCCLPLISATPYWLCHDNHFLLCCGYCQFAASKSRWIVFLVLQPQNYWFYHDTHFLLCYC